MEKYYWLNEGSREFLSRDYLIPGTTPEQRIRDIAVHAGKILNIPGFADKFEDYMSRGWYSLSTPIWCNFGLDRGLSISCFSIDIQDNISDILKGIAEIGTMAKYGGGTAGYFGNLRARGAAVKNNGTSSGSVHFMEPYQTIAQVINQGQARRGHFSAFLPVTHLDIEEFLRTKEEGHPLQHISFGVTIPDNWMEDMIAGDTAKRELMVKIHKSRSEKGMPYIMFEGNTNKYKPKVYLDKGLHIKQSNMCMEIQEYTDEFKSFVCCISSMNLLHFDEWKDTDAVETMAYFLDAVYTDFINKAQHIPFMDKAVRFAKEHRSIGIGALGYHSYLQSKMIPFESMEAKLINSLMFKTINDRSLKASRELALLFGEPLILQGYGERFTTRVAIAPTTSSSFILGQVSPSIEPLMSNYFLKDLAKGVFTYRNPYLKQVLEAKGEDTEKTWKSIMMKGGSVQHLNFLSEHEKAVFKTFSEISQLEIIQQAAARQKFIDQAQSLNLMIPPDATIREINLLVIEAWKLGIKTLYYQRGANMAQQVGRSLLECVACE